jgi:hypothetical protein
LIFTVSQLCDQKTFVTGFGEDRKEETVLCLSRKMATYPEAKQHCRDFGMELLNLETVSHAFEALQDALGLGSEVVWVAANNFFGCEIYTGSLTYFCDNRYRYACSTKGK